MRVVLASLLAVLTGSEALAQPCVSCWTADCRELSSYVSACEAKPEAPRSGTLSVTAKPWAKVSVDGQAWGTTPVQRTIAAGTHRIVLTKDTLTVSGTVTVPAGGKASFQRDLDEWEPGPAVEKMRRSSLRVTNSIPFEPGAVRPGSASSRIFDDIAEVLRQRPDLVVLVAGNTDSQGSEEANLARSLERAVEVRKALVSRGVPRSRLAIRGFGETRPIDTNATAAGRARNNRVEFEVFER